MNIWIFQTGEPLHLDGGNPRPMRAMCLANILNAQGHSVTIWSSAFFHQEKKHRSLEYKKIRCNELLEIRLIPSPGYNNNFDIKRLYDHFMLAINLKKILKQEVSTPDVAFIGYPPIEFAYVAQKWLAKRNVPTMLDIKDLWPEIFVYFLPKSIRILGKIFLFPYFYLAKKVINDTTAVSSMTDAFLNYAISSFGRKRSTIDLAFPFSSPKIKVTKEELNNHKNWWYDYKLNKNSIFRISYIGNISSNIDLIPIMEAAIYFEKKFKQIEFVICGDGPLLEDYKKKFTNIKSVKFIGRVDHLQAAALSDISQATLIPYRNSRDFQLSLPNKFSDGLSYGLPILSTLSGEVANMINKYNIGISYGKPFNRSLIDAISILLNNNLLKELVGNCHKIYKKNFTYEKVYKNFSNHLTKIKLKV
jgi:glycosyltransferase involved in cell wall biosynthesis